MQIGVALAVRVRRQVDGHAVDEDADVGAVVGVEAAQEQLVGLAAALVLRGEQPRHHAQDVVGRILGPQLEVLVAHVVDEAALIGPCPVTVD